MAYKPIVLLVAGSLGVWAAGCSDNPVKTKTADQAMAEEFGGYTATNEAPAFGDPELGAVEGEEREIDDPILTSPSVQEMVDNADAGIFHFRAVWGRIPYDSTVTVATDWTGSLTLSRGAIVLRRLIRFEPPTDSILPRTAPGLLQWVSYTTVHNDGVAVDLFVPPAPPTFDSSWIVGDNNDSTLVIDTIPPEPATLTFATGPYTRTFTLRELASLEDLVALDDGNKVAFHSVQLMRQLCPRGVLAGRWGLDSTGNGVFKGLWMSGAGHVTGYLEGRYGQDEQGVNVFYGKWIDREGKFEGLLRGTWLFRPLMGDGEADGQRRHGWFAGRIFDANRNPIGFLSGHFGAAPDYNGGWFQGRWKLGCPQPVSLGGPGLMEDGIGAESGS